MSTEMSTEWNKNCKYGRSDCMPCTNCDAYIPTKTNADRIRAMTDEELFVFAKKQIGCGFDFFPCGVVCDGKCESYSDEECKAKVMNWLQQPAEEDNDDRNPE